MARVIRTLVDPIGIHRRSATSVARCCPIDTPSTTAAVNDMSLYPATSLYPDSQLVVTKFRFAYVGPIRPVDGLPLNSFRCFQIIDFRVKFRLLFDNMVKPPEMPRPLALTLIVSRKNGVEYRNEHL